VTAGRAARAAEGRRAAAIAGALGRIAAVAGMRGRVPAVAVVAGLVLAEAGAGAASAKTIAGVMRDVPTGTRLVPPIVARAANLPYGGGPVLHSNRTHVIFWQPDGSGLTFDPGYEELIETFLSDLAAASHTTTNVYGLSGQYSDSGGPAAYDSTYGGAVVVTDPLPLSGCTEPAATGPGWSVCLTDGQLEQEIGQVIAADNLPNTNRDIYFLVTPNGLGSCTDSSSSSCALGGSESGYCGYHSQTPAGVLYAVIPYNAVLGHCQSGNPRPNSSPADPTISTISHEQIETITDPDGNAWIDAAGNEAADLCLTSFGPPLGGSGPTEWNETIHGGHFFTQEVWSNADDACEPRAKPDLVSFTLTHAAGRPRALSFTARGFDPEGRMVSFDWFLGDARAGLGRHISHTFRRSGVYRITLRTTDSWGNWAFATRTLTVTRARSHPTLITFTGRRPPHPTLITVTRRRSRSPDADHGHRAPITLTRR
jgi:PKD domain